jgi:hypothetical protein
MQDDDIGAFCVEERGFLERIRNVLCEVEDAIGQHTLLRERVLDQRLAIDRRIEALKAAAGSVSASLFVNMMEKVDGCVR